MRIVAVVPDLMDRSRFPTGSARFITDPAEIGTAALVIVDLDRARDPARFITPSARSIAFGSHVEETALANARSAGFDEVLSRSVFWRRLPDLLTAAGGPVGEIRSEADR